MCYDQEPINYAEQMSFLEGAIKELAQEAIAVFREDVPLFFVREGREVFLAHPARAAELDDAALKKFKETLALRGEVAATAMAEKLADPDLWLAGVEYDEESGSLFEPNWALWLIISGVCDDLEDILQEYGFPVGLDGSYGISYREPKRFISGHYLPSIAEKYWKRIAELKELRARLMEVEEERRRGDLLARWNRI